MPYSRQPSSDLQKVIDELHKVISGVSRKLERVRKWGWPTYTYKGNICNIVTYRNHINLHFFNGSRLEDTRGKLQGTGKGMRHLSYGCVKDINRRYVRDLIRAAMEYNETLAGPYSNNHGKG